MSPLRRLSWIGDVRAITFDFGNTLVRVDRPALRSVVDVTARAAAARLGPFSEADFRGAWVDERERQFREEVPRFREVDLAERFVRVLARLRGMKAPPVEVRWDDERAAEYSSPDEIAWAVEVYSLAFIDAIPPPPAITSMLARLAADRTLGILSNWPLAATVDRYAEAAGWDRYLSAIVVSERIGTIKPHPGIFAAALEALGEPSGSAVLHVGDDWTADVVGAKQAGWRAAYLRSDGLDSALPSSLPDGAVVPDVELETLEDLYGALGVRRSGPVDGGTAG